VTHFGFSCHLFPPFNLSNTKLEICAALSLYILPSILPQHDFRDLRHHIARQPTPSRPRLHTASPVSTPDDPLILSVLSIGQHPRRGYPITASALRHRHASSFSPAQNYRRSYDVSRVRGFRAEVDRNTHRNCALSRWILQKINLNLTMRHRRRSHDSSKPLRRPTAIGYEPQERTGSGNMDFGWYYSVERPRAL
jgi:hypothetical protein